MPNFSRTHQQMQKQQEVAAQYAAYQRMQAQNASRRARGPQVDVPRYRPRRRRLSWVWWLVITLVVVDLIIGGIYLAWRSGLITI